ncbi:MAG TPA: hypothetical protein VNU68_12945 [Verrucomicrobiae bacterium]|nr:hypothetical protein [Verrucomicrobiae bacterium]
MRNCSYCGGDIPEGEKCCPVCSCEQLTPDNSLPLEYLQTSPVPESPLLDLRAIPEVFRFEEAFSRPDWKVISQKIAELVSPEDRSQAWVEVVLQWLVQLRDELGGSYHVTESSEFFLLSALDQGDTQRVLAFAERALHAIREQFQDVAWKGFCGKHVVLLFMDDDDYYQYQAPFLRDGINVASGGVLLGSGYVHIAISYHAGRAVRPTLAHELAHNCVAHLPLPLWLNEGVAVRVERFMTRPSEPMLHRELADQHRNHWTETNIQEFWAGASFGQPGDPQTLSYSLAEILVELLTGKHQQFLEFMRQAHYRDGGQTAALDCLGLSLGDVAARFLGPGDWRPYRKALTNIWRDSEKSEG